MFNSLSFYYEVEDSDDNKSLVCNEEDPPGKGQGKSKGVLWVQCSVINVTAGVVKWVMSLLITLIILSENKNVIGHHWIIAY